MKRPSAAMVVATTALALSMGGVGFAAGTLIDGKNIKNGSITASKLSYALQYEVKREGRQGPRGYQGPVGPQGPPGVQTTAPVSSTVNVPNDGNVYNAVAGCPAGAVVTGGGYYAQNFSVTAGVSQPVGNGWQVQFVNRGPASYSATAYAICATV